MDRREFLINILFIIVVLPIIFVIFQGYMSVYFNNKNVDLANPLNLRIYNVFITDYGINFQLYNPNNVSYPISISMVGLRNSFGSVSPITEGGDINVIKTLPAHQNMTFFVPIIRGTAPENVLIQWKKGGGNLTIVVYYAVPNTEISGVVLKTISK